MPVPGRVGLYIRCKDPIPIRAESQVAKVAVHAVDAIGLGDSHLRPARGGDHHYSGMASSQAPQESDLATVARPGGTDICRTIGSEPGGDVGAACLNVNVIVVFVLAVPRERDPTAIGRERCPPLGTQVG